jgi:CDP-glucose 4,6-dehydratase
LRHWDGKWVHNQEKNAPAEAAFLHLSIDRAAQLLKWQPTWGFNETVYHTIDWYRHSEKSDNNMMRYSINQIHQYCKDARLSEAVWAEA